MLEVQKLRKSYGKSLAVDDVSFLVPDGTVGILLGPNGAGKSTIIKSIAGLLRYQGRIGIQGLTARSVEAKRLFAYVPEMPAMFDALSVREHIEYIRKAYNSQMPDEEVEALLERFDLDDKQEKLGNELSKGMMQKVSICCALAICPRVLLLDEPMVGLDPKAIKELKEVIREQKEKGSYGSYQYAYAGDGRRAVGCDVCDGKEQDHRLLSKRGCGKQRSGCAVF